MSRHCTHCDGRFGHVCRCEYGCPLGPLDSTSKCGCPECGCARGSRISPGAACAAYHWGTTFEDVRKELAKHQRACERLERSLIVSYQLKMTAAMNMVWGDYVARNKILFRKTLKFSEHIKRHVLSFLETPPKHSVKRSVKRSTKKRARDA